MTFVWSVSLDSSVFFQYGLEIPSPDIEGSRPFQTHPSLKVKSGLVSHIGVFGPPFCIFLIKTPNQIQGKLLSVFSVRGCCYDYDFWIILKSVQYVDGSEILQNTSWGWDPLIPLFTGFQGHPNGGAEGVKCFQHFFGTLAWGQCQLPEAWTVFWKL